MGRINRKRKKHGERKQFSNDPSKYGQTKEYKLTDRKNELFEHYYKEQKVVPDGEWVDFLDACKRNLPSTFRITGNKSQSLEILKIIKSDYFSVMTADSSSDKTKPLSPPQCLPWFPEGLAWQLNYTKNEIKKDDTLQGLHQFLVSETESGNISRQEAVSMIPPLVLDVQPHHKVLDMCAAPGSKTAQLIEKLHADDNVPIPGGFVVANDSDNKRCYLMVHQVRRLQSPCFMIVNHDASVLPRLELPHEEGGSNEFVKYDRVLADVPCSGDGTMRKNPDIWRKWNPGTGMNLHSLQIRILKRGVDLLGHGGRIVYSTCSLNPIENEAVVAEMLNKYKGTLKLVEASSLLPGLKSIPGMTSWKVMTKSKEWYENYEDVPATYKTQIFRSMFPPTNTSDLHLERCIRILPHFQNTGAFFIAVFEKAETSGDLGDGAGINKLETVSEQKRPESCGMGMKHPSSDVVLQSPSIIEATSTTITADPTLNAQSLDGTVKGEICTNEAELRDEMVITEPSNGTDSNVKKNTDLKLRPAKKRKLQGYKEDPFIYFNKSEEIWPPIQKFFKLTEGFDMTQLLVRCETGKKRHIYYTSPVITQLVKANEDKVKIINLGVRMFSRSDSPIAACPFRLTQEGMNTVMPFIRERIAPIEKRDIVTLMTQENPYITKMTDACQAALDCDPGAMVYVYTPKEGSDGPRCPLTICGWRGKTSCRSFVPKNERIHFLRLCGIEYKEKSSVEEVGETKHQQPTETKRDLDDFEQTEQVGDEVSCEDQSIDGEESS